MPQRIAVAVATVPQRGHNAVTSRFQGIPDRARVERPNLFNRLMAAVLVVLTVSACSGTASQSGPISGAGATFPAPLYARWASDYHKITSEQINYQGIGSGGGIKQIEAGTVDFGATDKPLKADDLAAKGLIQFPMAMGGVVPVVNVAGVGPGQLRLSGQVLADIFLGRILQWNDPAIGALNPGVALPATPITVVHRADGSGTTYLFSSYLAASSADWNGKPGASDSLQWPTGLGGKGNDGVAAFVRQTNGSIGYVEYAYAKQNALAYTLVRNKAGRFPAPGNASFAGAATAADWNNARGMYMLLLDQAGNESWPITAVTYILVRRQPPEPNRAARALRFFDWALANGDAAAAQLGYVPLPASVKAMVREQWGQVQVGGNTVPAPKRN